MDQRWTRMRFVSATFGLLATIIGSNWLLFGVGLIASKNIVCFDVCGDYEYGPNQFWMFLGIGLLLVGVVAVMRAVGHRRQ